MVFATDIHSLSKSFLLVLSISGLQIGAADPAKKDSEKLATMPTMYECINGGHMLIPNGFAFYAAQLNDACEDAIEEQDVLDAHRALGNITILMNVPLVKAWSSESKDVSSYYGRLEELTIAIKGSLQTQKPVDSNTWSKPEREIVQGFGAVHNNVNFERIFYMVGGHTVEQAALNALSQCSQKTADLSGSLTSSATCVSEDNATVLSPCIAKYNLYVEAAIAVVESLSNDEHKKKLDLNNKCSEILTLSAETIEGGLEKAANKYKISDKTVNEESMKKQKVSTILSSALINFTTNTKKLTNEIGILCRNLQDIDQIKNAEELRSEVGILSKKIQLLTSKQQMQSVIAKNDLRKVTNEKIKLAADNVIVKSENDKLKTDITKNKTTITELNQKLTQLKQIQPKPKSWSMRSFIAGSLAGSLFINVTALCAYHFFKAAFVVLSIYAF